ncbi:MAG: AzlC family ABC transporter permease [Clostridia bacterium]|nr:AzlC family ABC transporter permease [Clostridia bacterium]MBQ7315813.1 AzlC family ABC transporter permease [Clostridia bacterium]
MSLFMRGLKGGIPIGLGYLSVSFTFGIMAVSYGFAWWQAVVISMMTLTSAGQLAGIGVMVHPGQYMEMLISQITINLRYSFMSVSLSQKTSPSFRGIKRWLLGFFMTDEIFAVASAEDEVDTKFFLGLSVMPYIGWTLGTLFGSLLGSVLPDMVLNALCLAIYGMFLAIIAPVAKTSKPVLLVVAVAAVLHCVFAFVPVLNQISSGLTVSICAVLAAVLGAILFPVKDEEVTS